MVVFSYYTWTHYASLLESSDVSAIGHLYCATEEVLQEARKGAFVIYCMENIYLKHGIRSAYIERTGVVLMAQALYTYVFYCATTFYRILSCNVPLVALIIDSLLCGNAARPGTNWKSKPLKWPLTHSLPGTMMCSLSIFVSAPVVESGFA